MAIDSDKGFRKWRCSALERESTLQCGGPFSKLLIWHRKRIRFVQLRLKTDKGLWEVRLETLREHGFGGKATAISPAYKDAVTS